MIIDAFVQLWSDLFSGPVHVDSLLSKQDPRLKSMLARLLQGILLKPVSLGRELGVVISSGEPWSLSNEELAGWRGARALAEKWLKRDPDLSDAEGLMARLRPQLEDFPPEMVQNWEKNWGSASAQQLVDQLGRLAPLTLRWSRMSAHGWKGREDLLKFFQPDAEPTRFSPYGVTFSAYRPVLNNRAFTEGAFEIQDEGSQIMSLFALWPDFCTDLLRAEPGQSLPGTAAIHIPEGRLPSVPKGFTVVDACAGAGGKTLAMADLLRGEGRVYAYDVSEKKHKGLRTRAKRTLLRNVQGVILVDGEESVVVDRFKGKADLVLVDAPCSGWGVLRRNGDIKWKRDESFLLQAPAIQKRLLHVYAPLVKKGGRMVFGVCTFRPEETRWVVDEFLAEHPQFTARSGGYIGPGPMDGFFVQDFILTGTM